MGRLASQQAGTQRVKRRDPHPAAIDAEQRFNARPHLLRGLVRKCDREDAVGLCDAFADQVRDAMRDDAGLAGARAGKNQQRAIGVKNSFLLFRDSERREDPFIPLD